MSKQYSGKCNGDYAAIFHVTSNTFSELQHKSSTASARMSHSGAPDHLAAELRTGIASPELYFRAILRSDFEQAQSVAANCSVLGIEEIFLTREDLGKQYPLVTNLAKSNANSSNCAWFAVRSQYLQAEADRDASHSVQRANLFQPRNNRADSILAGCVGRKMTWESIIKLTKRNQLLDFFGEVRTNIAGSSPNFSH